MKKYVIAGIFTLLCMSIPFANIHAESFTRYLQKGDRGADVLALQKVLNADPETLVSDFGDGSLGQETNFFGELTRQAVIKLQKKHYLSSKYGFFTIYSGALDDKTRAFLNSTNPEKTKQENLNTSFQEKISTTSSLPFVRSVNPSSIISGDQITIYGGNFSTSTPNIVRMTYNTISALSPDGTTLQVTAQSALQGMFDRDARKLDDDEKDNVKTKIGALPLFLTVQNERGTSNPYQIYMSLK